MIPLVDLNAQYRAMQKRIKQRIDQVLEHGSYIMGPEVYELEEQLSEFTGAKHVISCANGTDALQMALMALNVKAGDAVFCPSFTFVASAEAIALVGATPIFVDVELDTYNICPIDLEKKILAAQADEALNSSAIITVDLFGLPANYQAIEKIAAKYGLKLVEDAAQSFGGEYHGKRTTRFGDIATTSFFPAKPLGCYGDGGAIFTDNDDYADNLRSVRVHGKGKHKYDNVMLGMNSRLDSIQAAILLEKLDCFNDELKIRNTIANHYTSACSANISAPHIPSGSVSAWAQYSVTHPDREHIQEQFKNKGISTTIYYEKSIHQQPYYTSHYNHCKLSNSEKLSRTILSIPVHPYLEERNVATISEVLSNI